MTWSEATLKKKHNAIACYWTREAVASGTVCMAWEFGTFDSAAVLTELLPGTQLHVLVSCILDWNQNGTFNLTVAPGTWGAESNLA